MVGIMLVAKLFLTLGILGVDLNLAPTALWLESYIDLIIVRYLSLLVIESPSGNEFQ